MPLPHDSVKSGSDGFEGELSRLDLSDLVQLKANNRFSGCVAVAYGQSRGLLFFRDGEIIHAEHEGKVGEEAFCCIVGWPGGRFDVQPNVATTRSTIQKSWQHLLLDAHRLLDERRAHQARPSPLSALPSAVPRESERFPVELRSTSAGESEPPQPPQRVLEEGQDTSRKSQPAAAPSTGRPASSVEALEKLRRIPGVVQVVLLEKEGVRIEDDSYQGEVLAGQAVYLAMAGRRLGSAFQLGEVVSAVIQGSNHHLLLFSAKSRFLCVLVQGQSQAGAVEAQVRRVLAGR